MPRCEIEARGVVYDAQRADRAAHERVASFTSLCPLFSGKVLCGFQLGSGKHAPDATIRLCASRDGGLTWRELPSRFATELGGIPGSLAAPEMIEVVPGRLLLFATWFDRSEPERPLFDPATEGILRSKQLCADSHNDGETWSDWRELPTPGLTGCATTGPVIAWSDGTLAYAFESFKEFDDPHPARHAAWLIASGDGGRTFSQPLMVAQDPEQHVYYWDQRLCATERPGEFFAMFWTHDRRQQRDLAVHRRRATIVGDHIHHEPIAATAIPGQIAAPLVLPDGRTLAFVVDRAGPCTLKLWSSSDGGATWPAEECLTVYTHEERAAISQGVEHVDFKQYWEDMGKWSFGHPAIRLLADGRVLLSYYAGTPGCLGVHWVRIRL